MPNIVIIESDTKDAPLAKALNAIGFETIKTHYNKTFLGLVKDAKPDALVLSIDTPCQQLIADLHKLNQEYPLPVILFANDSNNETINALINAEVSSYVVNGLCPDRLHSIIKVALARFKHQQALKEAMEEARSQLEDRKLVDRAKAILIKTQKFSEDEAYHKLRKLAMDRNITLGEMARNVIALAELFK